MIINKTQHRPILAQHGSALVVSLLILLVLTIIGVTSMTTTSLQSKMATNSSEYNMAFQAAESALRDGENDIFTHNLTGFADGCASTVKGLCKPSTSGTPVWDSIDWNAMARSYGSQTTASALSSNGVTLTPKYIIEEMAPVILSGNNSTNNNDYGNTPTTQYYRVTAVGTGPNGTGNVMLQSIYKP